MNSGWFTVINKQLNHLVVISHSYSSNRAILVKFHVCNHWQGSMYDSELESQDTHSDKQAQVYMDSHTAH